MEPKQSMYLIDSAAAEPFLFRILCELVLVFCIRGASGFADPEMGVAMRISQSRWERRSPEIPGTRRSETRCAAADVVAMSIHPTLRNLAGDGAQMASDTAARIPG
jgi:hypothetical protein